MMIKGRILFFVTLIAFLTACSEDNENYYDEGDVSFPIGAKVSDTIFNKTDLKIYNTFFSSINIEEGLVVSYRVHGVCQSCFVIGEDSVLSILRNIDVQNKVYYITEDAVVLNNRLRSDSITILEFNEKYLARRGLYAVLPYVFYLKNGRIAKSWYIIR